MHLDEKLMAFVEPPLLWLGEGGRGEKKKQKKSKKPIRQKRSVAGEPSIFKVQKEKMVVPGKNPSLGERGPARKRKKTPLGVFVRLLKTGRRGEG